MEYFSSLSVSMEASGGDKILGRNVLNYGAWGRCPLNQAEEGQSADLKGPPKKANHLETCRCRL